MPPIIASSRRGHGLHCFCCDRARTHFVAFKILIMHYHRVLPTHFTSIRRLIAIPHALSLSLSLSFSLCCPANRNKTMKISNHEVNKECIHTFSSDAFDIEFACEIMCNDERKLRLFFPFIRCLIIHVCIKDCVQCAHL